MGIEVSTFISGLTPSWPTSGDPKSQGDDQLRLIKSVLQSTFPNANKAFYFPGTLSAAGPTGTVLTALNDKATVYYTTAGGDATVTLPSGLAPADAGWSVEVVKYDVASNGVMVVPASGTIITQFGSVASVRVGSVCSPVRFVWAGASWMAFRHGPLIGSTMNFDGPSVPPGYFMLDGSVYNVVTYAELALALGTSTLRDKRGRAEIGAGTGSGLTNRLNNALYGNETAALSATHLPPQTPTGTVTLPGISGGGAITDAYTFTFSPGAGQPCPNRTAASITFTGGATFTGNAMPGQFSTPFGLLQPSIGSNKIIRAA